MVSTVYSDKGKSKASDTFITPKKNLFKRHTRTESSNSNNNESTSYNIGDNNNRGWLEFSSVQVNPSRSIDRNSMKPTTSTTTTRKEVSQKGLL
jgi:hypothetical protein